MAKKEQIGYKPIDNAYTKDIDAWFIIVMILFIFPIGVWLMWTRTSWKKWVKILVSVIVAVALVTSVISSMRPTSDDFGDASAVTTVAEAE